MAKRSNLLIGLRRKNVKNVFSGVTLCLLMMFGINNMYAQVGIAKTAKPINLGENKKLIL